MTPEQLREWTEPESADLAEWVAYSRDVRRAHAAALEEIERLNGDIRQMVEKAADKHLAGYRELGAKCAALETRAEQAERRAERLEAEHYEAILIQKKKMQEVIDYWQGVAESRADKGE